MVVDAKVYRWHSAGMTENPFMSGETYVTVREAERMLEAAHRRGYERGRQSLLDEQKMQTRLPP